MKGLAAVLGKATGPAAKLGPKPPPIEPVEEEEAEMPDTDASSETELATLAAEALAAGDTEAGAEALISTIKACLRSYGPKK